MANKADRQIRMWS